MHSILPFLLAMVTAVVLLQMLATKLKIAYPIIMVIAGLLISFVPRLPVIHINPDLIFFILLPPLLWDASWSISFKEMRKWWRIISSFAFLVVFFTALSVAVVTNYIIPGFTLALGFLLGGIVSPPDAVSTGAITKFVNIPRTTSAILEGESLLNDASSLIIFRFAFLAVGTGSFIWQEASLSFLWMLLGGVGIGLLTGWMCMQIHKWLPTDAPSDITLTFVEPYFMYWIAEQVHSSGVLAVVCGGLYMSNHQLKFLNSRSRVRGYSVWESVIFVINGIVFLMIGLDLPEIVDGLRAKGIPLKTAIGYGVIVTAVLILARIVSSYVALIATLIFRPSVAPRAMNFKRRFLMPLVLGWTGMRGVVSLAAALSIPVVLGNGKEFPQRNLILFITFIVILLTLVIQGLTLPTIIRLINPFGGVADGSDENVEKRMKRELKEHVYNFLQEKSNSGFQENRVVQKLLRHWEEKSKSSDDEKWMNEDGKQIYIELLQSQRAFLEEFNKDPNVNEDMIRRQIFQIDLEEERIKML